MKKSESNQKRKRVDIDQCGDDFKENFQPLSEKQFPGILKKNTRTSVGISGPDTEIHHLTLSRSEKVTHNSRQTKDVCEYTGSSPLTKKSKQGDPPATVMADHFQTSSAAQPSDILKPLAGDENLGTTNQAKPHKCPICSKSCTRKNYLANHMKSHDKKETQKTDTIAIAVSPEKNIVESYRCLICFESFSRLNYLTNHTRSHDRNSVASDKNTKFLSAQRKLKLHVSTLTKERLFECAFCQKSFGQSQSRDKHLLTHLGEKHYSCHLCEKSFVQKSNLKAHLKIHTREMPQSQSTDSNEQQTGEELFSGEKSRESQNVDENGQHIEEEGYKCTSCSKSFCNSAQLKVHVRMHMGKERYKCSQCLKSFTHSYVLKRHLIIHTGEKPYKCKYCLKRFNDPANLTRHVRTIHEEKQKNVFTV